MSEITRYYPASGGGTYEDVNGTLCLYSEAYEVIAALREENEALKSRERINVNERLPNIGGRYLAYYPNIYGWEIDTFDGMVWGSECDGYKVTHWKSLPDAPNAEVDDLKSMVCEWTRRGSVATEEWFDTGCGLTEVDAQAVYQDMPLNYCQNCGGKIKEVSDGEDR